MGPCHIFSKYFYTSHILPNSEKHITHCHLNAHDIDRHDIETFSALLVRVNHRWPVDSSHKLPVIWSFKFFFGEHEQSVEQTVDLLVI